MSANFRYPNITGSTDAERIDQIRSFLHQLVQELNWALSTMEPGSDATSETVSAEDYADMVYELKSLIVQSSSTLNAYYEKINSKLQGQYVSHSAFDAYTQKAEQDFAELPGQYVDKNTFEAYKNAVEQTLSGIPGQYVGKETYEAHVQEMSQTVAGMDSKYVSSESFASYMTETAGILLSLQQQIDALKGETQ
jgi:antirestriction protein